MVSDDILLTIVMVSFGLWVACWLTEIIYNRCKGRNKRG